MPTDAERWRFLADHKLTLHADGGDYLVHWVRTGGVEPPKFYPVSNGRTPEEAIDRAIERYNRKHGLPQSPALQQNAPLPKGELGVRRLPIGGWVTLAQLRLAVFSGVQSR
jgi:hypothetical protein